MMLRSVSNIVATQNLRLYSFKKKKKKKILPKTIQRRFLKWPRKKSLSLIIILQGYLY